VQTIQSLGSSTYIGIILLIIFIILLAYVLKLLLEFLPATLLAILVYIFTADLLWTFGAFLMISFLMTLSNLRKGARARRSNGRYYR